MRKPRTRAVCAPTTSPTEPLGLEIASPVDYSQPSRIESSTRQSEACSTAENAISKGYAHLVSFQPVAPSYKYFRVKITTSSHDTFWFIPVNAVEASLIETMIEKHDAETREK